MAALAGQGLPPETTSEIRERLTSGERVEVSGYTLGEDLVRDYRTGGTWRGCSACAAAPYTGWENLTGESPTPGAAVRKALTALEQGGNRVQLHPFSDPPLWQLHKRDSAPELLDLTTGLLA